MRRTLLGSAAGLMFAFAAQSASAADIPPPVYKAAPAVAPSLWYAEIYGGWTRMRNYNYSLTSTATGTVFPYAIEFDNGWVIGGALGRQVTPWLRLEVDVSHGRNRDRAHVSTGTTAFVGTNVTGSFSMTTVTGNAWISAPMGPVSPYAGGGVGWGWVRGSVANTNGCACTTFDNTDGGLAFVGGVGVRFGAWNNVEIDVGYRYRHVNDINFTNLIPGFTGTSTSYVATHAIQAGLVVKF